MEFDDGFRVIVYAKVADAIYSFWGSRGRARLFDDERSRLLPAPIATGGLTRVQRRHHPLGQRPVGDEKRGPHCGKNLAVGKHVPLYGEPGFGKVPGPLHAACPCVSSSPSVRGDHAYLPKLRLWVPDQRSIERLD